MTLYLETASGFVPWAGEAIDDVRHPLVIETVWAQQELAAIGLYKPAPADQPPTGKVIVSTSVERVGGVVKFVHVLEDVPFSEAQAAKHAAINAKVEVVLSSGFTVPSGVMAGKVLQTRDSDDRINWLVSQANYSIAVAAGAGAVENAEFRTADNLTFIMSYADGLNVLMEMAAWGAACMKQSWTLKDAVAAAEDQAALDAVDIEAGWP